jgi:hypothetical protein
LREKRTTSLLIEPRDIAILLPSGDKEMPKMRPEIK